ncbi:MAG: EAL domain-containing protein, partial [Clostridiales bacterium]|nr:EAL domain-containing protein [Clostridiales bacterium]
MDDFGSGFSSLNMLKDLPVDVLKIDMKFLNKAEDDAKAKTILQNIINLSEDLGISSLTEGVETKEQHDMLSGMGCKLFQGFYFAEPMPEDEFEKIIC